MENKEVTILGTVWNIHIVKEFPEHLKEHEETATGLCNGFDTVGITPCFGLIVPIVPTIFKSVYLPRIRSDTKSKFRCFWVLCGVVKNTGSKLYSQQRIERFSIFRRYRFSGCWATNEEMVDWFAIQSTKIYDVYLKLGLI